MYNGSVTTTTIATLKTSTGKTKRLYILLDTGSSNTILSNKYLEHITNQINSAVKGLRKDKVENLVFAYEPIWAIGTGEVASVVDAVEVLSMVKENISEKPFYDSDSIRFIYGGSVTPDNSSELLNSKIIDGALVGGASLDVDKFVTIINSVDL